MANGKLTPAEWVQVATYLSAANNVRSLIFKAQSAGKQQVSITSPAVAEFVEAGETLDPSLWFRLGGIIGQEVVPGAKRGDE